ncbi:hypothetical protein [Vibrio alginolyticus]|uniref:hypothetical protein n=1 Tax=Vibrio alginolyticus TaxID=663 RepID=UPI0007211678|nr:hypothetical protein [Vibrio alginolyticus]ALR95735.1 hypothetical protein AT730_26220 [Vibrio alginolyticus]MBY7710929.1 hypothetical protein [Vibrio alginolyticus]
MNTYGVAIFNDEKKPRSGFSCVDGKVKEFSSYSDLEMSTIWVTNIQHSIFQKEALYKVPNLRSSQYLRLSLQQIMRELNVKKDIEGIQHLAKLVQSIASDLQGKFELNPDYLRYRLGGEIPQYLESQGFLPSELLNISELADASAKAALNDAYQSFQGTVKSANGKIYHYTLPRVAHFEYLMNQNFPLDNNWEEFTFSSDGSIVAGYKNKVLLPDTEKVIIGLKNLHKNTAAILNIKVKSIDPKRAQSFTFGIEGVKSTTRIWAALPEVIDILRYCEVEILGGLKTNAGKLDVRPEIDLSKNRYSYSKGVVSENIWCALADKVHLGSQKQATGLGVYLRAYDRIICSKLAEAFMKAGFVGGGFGVGAARVWLSNQDVKKANIIAEKFGAMPDIGV